MKTETETTPTPATPTPVAQKSATITLRAADGSTMQICAERKGDGAKTYVITTGVDKKSARGMSMAHESWDAAVACTAATAEVAAKLGWTRRVAGRMFTPKPDAFSSPPKAPKGKKS